MNIPLPHVGSERTTRLCGIRLFCSLFLQSESDVHVKGVFPGGMLDPQLEKMGTTDVKQSFSPLTES